MRRIAVFLLVLSGAAAAQMPNPRMPQCAPGMLQGTYAISYQGWMYFPAGGGFPEMTVPGVILGVRSISATGAITGNATVILPFGKADYETTAGSFASVNPDCTGTMTRFGRIKGSSDTPSKEVDRFVFLRETGELLVIKDQVEGAIPMALGTWKRIATTPEQAQW